MPQQENIENINLINQSTSLISSTEIHQAHLPRRHMSRVPKVLHLLLPRKVRILVPLRTLHPSNFKI